MKEARRWGSLAILSVLLLSIGAVMADSGLGCGPLKGNSIAATARLRVLVMQQEQFRAFGRCDLDGDGEGEYGTLGEMTAATGIRSDPRGATRGPALAEPLLSPTLAATDGDGIVTKSGYALRILLPAKGGGAAHEGRPGEVLDRPVDTDAAETAWCAYAWPVARASKDPRAFFVTARGHVFATANDDLHYFGDVLRPAWDGACPSGTGNGWSLPPEGSRYVGRDGNVWTRTD